MTEQELEQLIADCPTLYHMAERGSWASIQDNGLLSTSALLKRYNVGQPLKDQIEAQHRPNSIAIDHDGMPRAVVRDQMPMSDAGLERCLPEHLTPSDWYKILNAKVFFWLSQDRLHRLTGAKAYRELEHDVLEVDTRSLVDAHRDRIWLCPINSGCTKPMPRARDETVFSRIDDYPYAHWKKKRSSRKERVVELCVDDSVPDIAEHVRRVVVKRGDQVLETIHE